MNTIETFLARLRGAAGTLTAFISLIAFLIHPQLAVAQQSISGTPGVATQQAVVNFTDLAQQEALAPPVPREPKAIHPPYACAS